MLVKQYPNRNATQYLVQDFTKGFSLQYNGPMRNCDCKNQPSALARLDILEEEIQEIKAGHYLGPFE